MENVYLKDDDLLRDYRKLTKEYKNKAGKYIKNLLRLQRAEKGIQGKLCIFKHSGEASKEDEICCSFCQKPRGEVFRLIAAVHDDMEVYICDECARICGEIIEEEEAAEGKPFAD